eukprot:7240443-Prymnesium_polylepis.1
MMLTSFAAYSSDIAAPIEASANNPTKSAAGGVLHAHDPFALARLWWEVAHLNGWGYGRSMLNGGQYPSGHRCTQ